MLKLCPICRYHKPTRGSRSVCSACRLVARRKAQLAHLPVAGRTFFRKLICHGMSRNQAMHEAMKACP